MSKFIKIADRKSLIPEQVKQIKNLYFNYSLSTNAISKLFNVSEATIQQIIKGVTYKYVDYDNLNADYNTSKSLPETKTIDAVLKDYDKLNQKGLDIQNIIEEVSKKYNISPRTVGFILMKRTKGEDISTSRKNTRGFSLKQHLLEVLPQMPFEERRPYVEQKIKELGFNPVKIFRLNQELGDELVPKYFKKTDPVDIQHTRELLQNTKSTGFSPKERVDIINDITNSRPITVYKQVDKLANPQVNLSPQETKLMNLIKGELEKGKSPKEISFELDIYPLLVKKLINRIELMKNPAQQQAELAVAVSLLKKIVVAYSKNIRTAQRKKFIKISNLYSN